MTDVEKKNFFTRLGERFKKTKQSQSLAAELSAKAAGGTTLPSINRQSATGGVRRVSNLSLAGGDEGSRRNGSSHGSTFGSSQLNVRRPSRLGRDSGKPAQESVFRSSHFVSNYNLRIITTDEEEEGERPERGGRTPSPVPARRSSLAPSASGGNLARTTGRVSPAPSLVGAKSTDGSAHGGERSRIRFNVEEETVTASVSGSGQRKTVAEQIQVLRKQSEAENAGRRLSAPPQNLSNLGQAQAQAQAQAQVNATGLFWQGDKDKRFVMLRGTRMVRESELGLLHSIFIEVYYFAKGDISLSALRVYVAQLNPLNIARVRVASSLCSAIEKTERNTKFLVFEDILRVVYPAASPEEREFLARSAEEMHSTSKSLYKSQEGSRSEVLSQYTLDKEKKDVMNSDVMLASKIFHLLDKKNQSLVSISALIQTMVSCNYRISERKLQRQFSKFVPAHAVAVDKETFLRVIAYHLSSPGPTVDLKEMIDVVEGYEVVLARYVGGRLAEDD